MNNWIKNLVLGLRDFLKQMGSKNYSYFKYSLTGDLYKDNDKWGLANSVFAAKIFYITGLLNELTEEQKNNIIRSIKGFEFKGLICDPTITNFSKLEIIKKKLKLKVSSKSEFINDIRRAETRQSFSSLYLLNSKPSAPYNFLPYSEFEIEKYLEKFDWSLPWHAGSHFSHLMFFLWYNSMILRYRQEETRKFIPFCVNWISGIQNRENGCWYKGKDIPLSQKINGAMKIITGFHAVNRYDFPYPKKLIDTALSGINDAEACSNFNISYVLFSASRIEPEYRKNEINDFLINRLRIYRKFYWSDIGGFSFYQGRANDVYYGKKITQGKPEPDIHGTIMFVWGIALIDRVLNLGLNWKIPLN